MGSSNLCIIVAVIVTQYMTNACETPTLIEAVGGGRELIARTETPYWKHTLGPSVEAMVWVSPTLLTHFTDAALTVKMEKFWMSNVHFVLLVHFTFTQKWYICLIKGTGIYWAGIMCNPLCQVSDTDAISDSLQPFFEELLTYLPADGTDVTMINLPRVRTDVVAQGFKPMFLKPSKISTLSSMLFLGPL